MMPAAVGEAMANGRDWEDLGDAVRRPAADRPALPYAKAFVVHFTAESDARLERASGRVEHLQSGRRVRFASAADLLACIVELLADAANEPPSP
jgi:hypothetical protein